MQHGWSFPTIATAHTLLMLMTAASRMRPSHPEYSERAMSYFEDAKSRDIRCVQTITDAKGHRGKSASQQDDPDLYLRMVDRSGNGM
jgi:4-hydroxybutyryl-CoA dehydratase/vinylacetyl-CoA-Delta-isomerase